MPTTLPFKTLTEILPHREPMILIDAIRAWDESSLEAVVEHNKPSIFTDAEGRVPAWVGIEYMAQAIGAWVGIRSIARGDPIRIGFLLGTRKYTTYRDAFRAGEKVVVRVEKLLLDEDGLALFDCAIFADNLLATAQIKAIQPQNVDDILRDQA